MPSSHGASRGFGGQSIICAMRGIRIPHIEKRVFAVRGEHDSPTVRRGTSMYSLGTVPFSPTSDWNQMIAQDASYTKLDWPESTGYNYSVNWDQYSPALYVASPTDPMVQVQVPASWGHPGGTISVRMPTSATGAVGTDGELLVIDGDKVYNFWQFERTGTTTATASSYGWTDVVTGSGWGSKTPFLGAGTTAVGSSQLGGLLVQAETDAGEIKHALQLVVDYSLVKSGFANEAIAGDGGSSSGIVREGELLGIPPGTPMPAGLSPLGQKVFRALQQYGAYVVDVAGGATVIRAQANAYDLATMDALWQDMGKITPQLQLVTGGTIPAETPQTPQKPTETILSTIAASGSGITNGDGRVSSGTVQVTLGFSGAVNVTGTPTLTLNDGGVARYVSGSGTNKLVFSHQIGAGQNTSDLAVTSFNLSGVKDTAGNAVSLTNAPRNPSGTLVIDTQAAKVSAITASGSGITNGSGTLNSGVVRLSLAFDEAVKVDGAPSLKLNNGGTANYVSGSGTKTLAFDYQVAPGQNTADLAVSAYNLGVVKDLAGNALDLVNAPTNPAGTLKIDTAATPTTPTTPTSPTTPTRPTTPTSPVTRPPVVTRPSADVISPKVDRVAVAPSDGRSGTITLKMSENVIVSGTPWLRLQDGSKARYKGGSGSNTLTFTYDSWGGRQSNPRVVGVALPSGSSITDAAGNDAILSKIGVVAQGDRRDKNAISGTTDRQPFAPPLGSKETILGGSNPMNRAGDFGGRQTLAFVSSVNADTTPNATQAGRVQLLGQYIASSFANAASPAGETRIHDAHASSLAPTLTRSS